MGDFSSDPYGTYVTTRRRLEVINGTGSGYSAVNRAYAGRSHPASNPPRSTPSRMIDMGTMSSSSSSKAASSKSKGLFNGRELKRKKRIAEYKWYAVEGKVKASLKNGYRWFKRRCSQIVRGF